jgi:hypothetical protein
MRRTLHEAVDALLDDELHERLWLHGERRNSAEMSFDDAVLVIIDEMATAAAPRLRGGILVDDREFAAFRGLSEALEKLVNQAGLDYRVARDDPEWGAARAAAAVLRKLLDGSLA